MTYEEALRSLEELEGRPVALDGEITRPADPSADPGLLRWTDFGVVHRFEVEQPVDRPIDEAAWWTQPRDRPIFRLAHGRGVLLMWREKFHSAAREDGSLVVSLGAFRYRLTPLVRPPRATATQLDRVQMPRLQSRINFGSRR